SARCRCAAARAPRSWRCCATATPSPRPPPHSCCRATTGSSRSARARPSPSCAPSWTNARPVESTRTLLELGGTILVLGILGRLAARIGLSPIPLYLLAGLMFGVGGLLPLATSDEFIATGADVGVILLLLLLGLEYSAEELITNLRANSTSGLIDFVVN